MLLTTIVLISGLLMTPSDSSQLELQPGDRIAIVGNTFAERMQLDGQFEALLHAAYPDHDLSIRNLGWSGDELALQPRPLNFIGMDEWLSRHQTDVLIGCFGMNESFAGDEGIRQFRADLQKWITDRQAQKYNGESSPRLALVSPIAHEDLGEPLPDGREHNFVLRRYVDAMREIAASNNVIFIDLLAPTLEAIERGDGPLTINGIHPNHTGYRLMVCAMGDQLGIELPGDGVDEEGVLLKEHELLRQAILAKNRLFFQRWRPTNTEYVYGRRHEPFGSQNFPDEMKKLDQLVAESDTRIWKMSPGRPGCVITEEEY